jgi:hypothetical protein
VFTNVFAELIAHLASRSATLFVACAPIGWVGKGARIGRPESERSRASEGAAREGAVRWSKGGVHVVGSFFRGKHAVRFRYVDDISEAIVMQERGRY